MNGTVTYTWKDTSGQEHMLSLAYAAVPGQAQVNTEWYVPGYVATTLPVGADIAYSIIYAKGNSPPYRTRRSCRVLARHEQCCAGDTCVIGMC